MRDGLTADPYQVLGVRADAPAAEMRRAYLRLARQHHPDYFVDATPEARAAAEERMRAVNEAWATVGSADHRQSYDAAQERGFEPFAWVTDDEADPREAPDVPYRSTPAPTMRRRATTFAPVLLFAISVASGILGGVMQVSGLIAAAAVLFVLACVGFLIVPLLALAKARQDEG